MTEFPLVVLYHPTFVIYLIQLSDDLRGLAHESPAPHLVPPKSIVNCCVCCVTLVNVMGRKMQTCADLLEMVITNIESISFDQAGRTQSYTFLSTLPFNRLLLL